MSQPATISPLAELRHFVRGWVGDLRRACDWRNLVEAEAVESITADLVAQRRREAAAAHRAEVNDLEAAKLLERVLADGKVTPGEMPMLGRALRHVHHSAQADHQLTEELAI